MQKNRPTLPILAAIAGLSGFLMIAPAAAQLYDLPPAGDCKAMVAANSGKGIWFGEFSGRYKDLFDRLYPLAARGCFASEYACRRWTNEVLTIADGPGLMSCRPYNEVR